MILIVYYSLTGRTEKVINEISSRIECAVEKIIDKKRRKGFLGFLFSGRDALLERQTQIEKPATDLSKYNLIIVATPVWAGNITPALRTYLNLFKGKFKKIAVVITSGGKSDIGSDRKIVNKIKQAAGITPFSFARFSRNDFKVCNSSKYNEKLNFFIESLKK